MKEFTINMTMQVEVDPSKKGGVDSINVKNISMMDNSDLKSLINDPLGGPGFMAMLFLTAHTKFMSALVANGNCDINEAVKTSLEMYSEAINVMSAALGSKGAMLTGKEAMEKLMGVLTSSEN